MQDVLLLSCAYRAFIIELGQAFRSLRDSKSYDGFADTFIDAVKSPEVGFSVSEVDNLIKVATMFEGLWIDDLPSHHIMKIMTKHPINDELLESAKTLTVTDFKELVKDKELNTQERTYKYEIIKRSVESGSIKKVFGEELEEAVAILQKDIKKFENE